MGSKTGYFNHLEKEFAGKNNNERKVVVVVAVALMAEECGSIAYWMGGERLVWYKRYRK